MRLSIETLESRDNPATFGLAWPDGEHLTLSLTPDGTKIGGRTSSLQTLLSELGPQAQLDLLRAFQSWAVQSNVNLGLVADDGSAFGLGGANQGDPRFGDIRIGGIPVATDVLAVTAPYAPFDNYSGDVIVNTAAGYGIDGPDLYTALLQEAGHALGVGNSANPSSAMYETYHGPRGGLSAGDVASIQALYGPRAIDPFEGRGGNATPGSATAYTSPLTADLSSEGDVDVYRFTTGLLTRSVTVSLRAAGISLVTAKVELIDTNGKVVASALTTDPTANDVSLSSSSLRALTAYHVRVSSAQADVFGVGSYNLAIAQNSLLSDVTGLVGDLLTETGLNETLATATSLLSGSASVGPQTEFHAQGGFGSSSDVDVYRITVPPAATAATVDMLTTVWGQHGAVLDPWVDVYDALGHKLSTEVLTADGNTTTVQLRDVIPGRTYFLKLSSDLHARGNYVLSADIRSNVVGVSPGPTRTLDAVNLTAVGEMILPQTGQVHFVLSAEGAAAAGRGVDLVVTATDGTVVATLSAAAGRSRSIDVLLSSGVYSLRFRTRDPSIPVSFRLGAVVITDPIGATPADPTGTPQPTSPSSPTQPPPDQPPPAQPPSEQPPSEQAPSPTTYPSSQHDCNELALWY